MRRPVVLAALAGLVLVVAAGTGTLVLLRHTPGAQVRSQVQGYWAALGAHDCAHLDRYVGPALVAEARSACEAQAAYVKVRRLVVDDITVHGGSASAHVRAEVLNQGAQRNVSTTFRLTRSDGTWRITDLGAA